MNDLCLGTFELLAPIQSGGMGQVWRGVHGPSQTPVAVKVITADRARLAQYQEAFRHEVRSVARLSHPGVVMLFDYGEIPLEAERASGGQLVAGSPYLVMELASGGSLRGPGARLGWWELRQTLLSLLDALGHAHARGVIHRDIKPGNILRCTGEDLRPGLKLADFGLAHGLDPERSDSLSQTGQGTPYYMAPEQCWGLWREYGPWTDLYAFGCLVYELVTGSPPFLGDSFSELAMLHQNASPAPLPPGEGLPAGFQQWLNRLLAKSRADRYRCAADAIWGLLQLDPPASDSGRLVGARGRLEWESALATAETLVGVEADLPAAESGATADRAGELTLSSGPDLIAGTAPTLSFSSLPMGIPGAQKAGSRWNSWLDGAESWALDKVAPAAAAGGSGTRRTSRYDLRWVPPMTREWRRPEPPETVLSTRLAGVGLGLYSLRTVPLVGREWPRSRLWERLAEVRASGAARAVLVSGAAGVGKSRLVEWVAERAFEVGAARVLKARHDPDAVPGVALARMVQGHLKAQGLCQTRVEERLWRFLGESGTALSEQVWAISTLMSDAESVSAAGVEVEGRARRRQVPGERFVATRTVLEVVAAERPVILWLDDVQWGLDSIGLVMHLLAHQAVSPAPILVVMTVRDEALAQEPATREVLDALVLDGGVERLSLGPLEALERGRLVHELLGLQGELAARVEERTAGNPLFAVQLVEDWVQRGVLEPGPTGFVLREGATADLPDDLYAVWEQALRRVLGGRGPGAQQALELAAVLGQEVDQREWAAACSGAAVTADPALVEALMAARLVSGRASEWAFSHGLLRESLLRQVRAAGRWREAHGVCAQALMALAKGEAAPQDERLGRHLLESGAFEAALAPLLRGVRRRLWRSDFRVAHELLARRQRAAMGVGGAVGARAAVEGRALSAWVYRLEGRLDQARAEAQAAREQAAAMSEGRALAEATKTLAGVARVDGALGEARALSREAMGHFERAGDAVGVAGCHLELGWLGIATQQFDEAARHLEEARRRFEAAGDASGGAEAFRGLGQSALDRGDLDEAERYAREALVCFERVSDRKGTGTCLRQLASIEKRRRRWEEALDLYRQAQRHFDTIGNPLGVAICMNGEGEVARLKGDLQGAEAAYRGALRMHRAVGMAASAWYLHLNLGLVLLARNCRREARETLREGLAVLEGTERWGALGCVHVQLAVCETGNAARWEHHFGEAERLLKETAMCDPDTAWSAQLAGDLQRGAERWAASARAYRLAIAQWEGLGELEKAAPLRISLRMVEARARG